MTLKKCHHKWFDKGIESTLWIVAFGCAGWCGVSVIQTRAAELQADEIVLNTHSAAVDTQPGKPIGRLEIKAVGLSVPVLESYDPATLRRGIGHIPGTAGPGGLGNLVLVGHRDTFFRPLRTVHAGMLAEIISPLGRWQYDIDQTKIVDPNELDVLDVGEIPQMTLITCYPFEYIGTAPRRFVVRAHLRSVEAQQ